MFIRFATVFTLTALPGAALAQPTSECASDADCADGEACEVTGGSACACEPNTECDCAPVEYRSCVPGPCVSDADCGDGMVCASYEQPCATDMPCTSDGNCEPAPPCESSTVSVCAPKWVLPCQTAADCGDGFTCDPVQMCSCSGGTPTEPGAVPPDDGGSSDGSDGSGSGDADSGAGVPMPPEGDCTCEPSGTNACIAIQTPCEDASACPDGWSCEQWGRPATDCAEPDRPDGAEPADGGCGEEPPPEPEAGMCYPPYGVSFDSGVPRGDDAGAPQFESGTAAPADPTSVGGDGDEIASPGTDVDAQGCAGGAVPVSGLALLLVAAWRRRARVA